MISVIINYGIKYWKLSFENGKYVWFNVESYFVVKYYIRLVINIMYVACLFRLEMFLVTEKIGLVFLVILTIDLNC